MRARQLLEGRAVFLACRAHGATIGDVGAYPRPKKQNRRVVRHGGDALVSGVQVVKDAFPQGAGDDEAVVVQEEAVTFKHLVAHLPVGTAAGRVITFAASQRRYRLRVFRLRGTGHGDVAGGNGDRGGRR